ncbi:hypothetical protein LRS10_12595 [Phenylobacterium sp. J426]|uniref:hypothetical protein n=1 Tax=Phenylobacterium sp. J426 TaxID=2898439 RepID=UPI0021515A2A|nr:hypothetical protein [Phenylobacterium sp. J426]MCR5874940.1 hypothetical protein [Phenylobacterium sp. J426]
MPAAPEAIRTSRRDLVSRVATLELLVHDLVDLLWRLDPEAMDRLAREAGQDLEIQNSRIPLPAGEHQRERLYAVLKDRQRMLKPRRAPAAA